MQFEKTATEALHSNAKALESFREHISHIGNSSSITATTSSNPIISCFATFNVLLQSSRADLALDVVDDMKLR